MPSTFVSKENFRAGDQWLMTGTPFVPSTGATAGIPGTWTPAGSTPPAGVAELQGGIPNVVVASPTTGWTAGQFVQTATGGAPGRATWTGTGWVGGIAPGLAEEEPEPGPTDQLPEHPETLTVAQIQAWVDQNPHAAADVLLHEQARGEHARSTLVTWLEGFLEDHDGVDPA